MVESADTLDSINILYVQCIYHARVTELAYVFGSNPKFCEFDSHHEHQLKQTSILLTGRAVRISSLHPDADVV